MSAQIIQFPKRPTADRSAGDGWVKHCRDNGHFKDWDDDLLRALLQGLSVRLAARTKELRDGA